jgi:hypothetical protein
MQHLRRLVHSVVAGLVLAGLTFPGAAGAGAPSESGIVVRFEDIALPGYQDPTKNLVALTGPPAELACNGIGFEAYFGSFQIAATPPGAAVLRIRVENVPLHVYRAASIAELCGAVDTGDPITLIGSGTARITANDNDMFVSETRTNSYGDRTTGTIEDANGGRWSFTGIYRALVEPSEGDECVCRVVTESITLSPRG